MSSALPCGVPSAMSNRMTSPSSLMRGEVGERAADLSCADQGDLRSGHWMLSPLRWNLTRWLVLCCGSRKSAAARHPLSPGAVATCAERISLASKAVRGPSHGPADLSILAVAVPAVLFAGMSKGGFGSGAAFASDSDSGDRAGSRPGARHHAAAADADGCRRACAAYWSKWNWPDARILLLGAVPGMVLGAVFYRMADPDVIRFLIGGIAIVFVAWQMAQKAGLIRLADRPSRFRDGPRRRGRHRLHQFRQSRGRTAGRGLSAGAASAQDHLSGDDGSGVLGGEPVQVGLLCLHGHLHAADADAGSCAGAGCGSRHLARHPAPMRWFPDRLFFGLTYVLLTLTGIKLIWDALT